MTLSKIQRNTITALLISLVCIPSAQAGSLFEDALNLATLGQYDRQKKEQEARKRREAEERAKQAKIKSYREQIAAKKHTRSVLQNEISFLDGQMASKNQTVDKIKSQLELMNDVYDQTTQAAESTEKALLNQDTQDQVARSIIDIIKIMSHDNQNTLEVDFLEGSVAALSQSMEQDLELVMDYLSKLTDKTLVLMMGNLKFIETVLQHETKEMSDRKSLKNGEMTTLNTNIAALETALNNILNPPKPKTVTRPVIDRPICRGSRCTLVP